MKNLLPLIKILMLPHKLKKLKIKLKSLRNHIIVPRRIITLKRTIIGMTGKPSGEKRNRKNNGNLLNGRMMNGKTLTGKIKKKMNGMRKKKNGIVSIINKRKDTMMETETGITNMRVEENNTKKVIIKIEKKPKNGTDIISKEMITGEDSLRRKIKSIIKRILKLYGKSLRKKLKISLRKM